MKHGIGRYVEEQVVSIEHPRQENLKVSHEVQRRDKIAPKEVGNSGMEKGAVKSLTNREKGEHRL